MASSIYSFIAAFLGYWVAHYFACQRQRKEQKINFIFRELSDFVTIVDESIEELIRLSESDNFRQILLLRQRHINRKSEFVYKILQTAKIEDDKFYIATAKGLIAPTVLQFGSFFMGDSKDFIRIVNPKIGEEFK